MVSGPFWLIPGQLDGYLRSQVPGASAVQRRLIADLHGGSTRR